MDIWLAWSSLFATLSFEEWMTFVTRNARDVYSGTNDETSSRVFFFVFCQSLGSFYIWKSTLVKQFTKCSQSRSKIGRFISWKIEIRDEIYKWLSLAFTLPLINSSSRRFGSKTNAQNVASKTNRQDLKIRRTQRREKAPRRPCKIQWNQQRETCRYLQQSQSASSIITQQLRGHSKAQIPWNRICKHW